MLKYVILVSAILSLLILLRRVPGQNVFALGALILVVSGSLEIVSASTGLPFGKPVFHRVLGTKLFGVLPWSLPFMWLLVVLNSRGIAQLILERVRETRFYGYWLLGLSWMIAAFLVLNFEWVIPARNGSGMAGVFNRISAMPLFFLMTTIWLIDKKSQKMKPDLWPLAIWILLNSYFLITALRHHHPRIAAFIFGIAAIATFLALRARSVVEDVTVSV